jgi:thioredoxin reductase (NADPH)
VSDYDIIIIGGGPGGISALLWCHSLGLRGVLLEQAPELGGQMLQMFHPVIDYPGLLPADGRELRDRFVQHVQQLQLEIRTNAYVSEIDLTARRVRCNGEWLSASALIIATGAHQRRLGIPGETEFALHEDPHPPMSYANQPVCVIGGGDSAVQNSLLLAPVCQSVTLLHRSAEFRARPEWLRQAAAMPNLTLLPHTVPLEIRSAKQAQQLLIANTQTGVRRELPAAAVFVRIGITPNTEFLGGQLVLDEAGYISIDQQQRTSCAGVYAVGDVCRPLCLSVATAIGQGAIAVKAIAQSS